jgi:hypothetical protein
MQAWHRRAFERRNGLFHDVLTLLLVRWIAVAVILLGIAALASGEQVTAAEPRNGSRGAPRKAEDAR